MTRRLLVPTLLLLVTAGTLGAHDLFLRAESYFVRPDGTVRLQVLNGTFSKSENAVTKDRLRDLSIVSPTGVTTPLDVAGWADTGDTSIVTVRVGESGSHPDRLARRLVREVHPHGTSCRGHDDRLRVQMGDAHFRSAVTTQRQQTE